jgi:hypothetical protein
VTIKAADHIFFNVNDAFITVQEQTTAVGDSPGALASGLRLHGAQPNPFRGVTTVRFSLDRAEHVRLIVMDAAGREVAKLVDGALRPGEHSFPWPGTDVAGARTPSGMYFVRLAIGGEVAETRMVLLK